MPLSNDDLILTQTQRPAFSLDPALNMVNSLTLIAMLDDVQGLPPWIPQTAASLSSQDRHQNYLVCIGLHHAVKPCTAWPSFTDYLAHLTQVDPISLRDRVLDVYDRVARSTAAAQGRAADDLPTREVLLADADCFIAYLQAGLPDGYIDEALEREAHTYLNDPARMQALIVAHLTMMWEKYLAAEWESQRAQLTAVIEAFRQEDFGSMDRATIVHTVTNHQPDDHFTAKLEKAAALTFVPSPHLGPYIRTYHRQNGLTILFGARFPAAMQHASPALTRSELLSRLNALADDTRLRILHLLSSGEHCAQEIMTTLDLSQSATSRHLRQLSANGLVIERRLETGKCYQLNPERLDDTVAALKRYLDMPTTG